jgi:hypothetical protein
MAAINGPITCADSGGRAITYSMEDALYNKSVMQPIPTGGMISGILVYTFPDLALPIFMADAVECKLTFTDVLDRPYVAVNMALVDRTNELYSGHAILRDGSA